MKIMVYDANFSTADNLKNELENENKNAHNKHFRVL